MRKIEAEWEGLENIESLEHDGKTLHMFLINHANFIHGYIGPASLSG
jgi:hypothetical protein